MKSIEKNCVLKTIVIGTEKNTYEIIREIEDMDEKEGEEVVVIQVYPTIGIGTVECIDSTTLHLINKMQELNWRKVHLLNIFSTIAHGKLLLGNLKTVDEENIAYIKKILKEHGTDKKVIIAWGNNLTTNVASNQSKKNILESFQKMYPKGKLYHIAAESMEEAVGTHILFLGLRYTNDLWEVEEYPVKEEVKKFSKLLEPKKEEKKQEKKPRKKEEENVHTNNESA